MKLPAIVNSADDAAIEKFNLPELGELLRLSWQHERNIRAEFPDTDERIEEAFQISEQIVDRIASAVATTLEDFRVKAMAVSWCHAGKMVEFSDSTDEVLAAQIVNQLMIVPTSKC